MAELPSGTVTFLFTDLEGSTRQWEEHHEAMVGARARFYAIVDDAVAQSQGVVFSHSGDGVDAAFASATDAVTAAVDAQRGLSGESWGETGPLIARMGLHTGEGTLVSDEQYDSHTLNRCARLMGLAHGGQIVVSGSTAALVTDVLIGGLGLVDLGEHRLRDVTRPMQVYQVIAPGLRSEFPPLRSATSVLGNLPFQVTDFVGREAELRGVAEAVESARIVTLTGVGGAGKTRLALEFAATAQPRFRQGAWLCALAPLTSPDAVGPLVASVVNADLGRHGEWGSAIVETLRRRQLLLVLDNCEHVLDAAATLVDAVVTSCPDVVVLATSREGLGVAGERIVPVGSLAFPRVDDPQEVARETDAVRLFVSRASDVRPLATDDHDTIAAIAEVCRRLDGIPLAIELAAARTQSMSVVEIADHLDQRFKLLIRGARTALGRHQTLKAAIDWSFDLLNQGEQQLLTRASVFAGGFTLDAAAAVCTPETPSSFEALEHVDGLVRRSMLRAEESATTTRYRMLETIRQYSADRLEASGHAADTSRAHLAWCTAFAQEAGERLRSPNDAAEIARMERELDNVRASLQFAASIGELDAAKTLLASAPIGALWDARLGASMAELAKEVASVAGEADHPASAAVLSLLALEAALRFEGDEAVELAERAVDVARRYDDWLRTGPWMAWLLSSLIAGRHDTVMVAAREGLTRAVADGDAFAVAEWHAQLGIAHWITGDIDEAQRLTEIGLMLAEAVGADNLVMRNAFLRGAALLVPGSDAAIAFRYLKRAVQLGERVGGSVLYGGAAWAILLSNRGTEDLSPATLARELASNVPTPMFLIDRYGVLVYYNDAAGQIIGKPFAEVGAVDAVEFSAIFHLSELDGTPLSRGDSPTGIAFLQRRPSHQVLLATGLDGVRRAVQATAYPLFGASDENNGVVTVFWEHTSARDDGGNTGSP